MSAQTRIARAAALSLAALCLAGGYALAGSGWGLAAVLVLAAGGAAGRKLAWGGTPSALLAGTVAAAAGGVLLGAAPGLMIAASALALAGWELAGDGQPATLPGGAAFQHTRLRLLAVSVVVGLLAAEGLLLVRVRVPFGGMVLAALLVMGGLFLFFRWVQKPGK